MPDRDARRPMPRVPGLEGREPVARPPERVLELGGHRLLADDYWLHGSGNR